MSVSGQERGQKAMEKVLTALATAADGACALDQAQRVVFWNDAAERLLGYRAEEVCGRTCYEVFRGQPCAGCLECMPNCPVICATSRRHTVPSYNLLSQTKHGYPILLNVSVIVLPVTAGPLATIRLFRDVTRQTHQDKMMHRPH